MTTTTATPTESDREVAFGLLQLAVANEYSVVAVSEKIAQHRAEAVAEMQAELDEQCRLNGIGSEREAKLMAQVAELTKHAEELAGALDDTYPLAIAWQTHWENSDAYGCGKASLKHERITCAAKKALDAHRAERGGGEYFKWINQQLPTTKLRA